MLRAAVLGCEYCKRKVQARSERVPASRGERLWGTLGPEKRLAGSMGMPSAADFDCENCKRDCEAGARLDLVSRRERLQGGSQAREGVRGLPGYAPYYGLGQLVMQVRG